LLAVKQWRVPQLGLPSACMLDGWCWEAGAQNWCALSVSLRGRTDSSEGALTMSAGDWLCHHPDLGDVSCQWSPQERLLC